MSSLKSDLESVYRIIDSNLHDHPQLNSIGKTVEQWQKSLNELIITQIRRILKRESSNIRIDRNRLEQFINQKAFFSYDSKIIEAILGLITDINQVFAEWLKKHIEITFDIKDLIVISNQGAFNDTNQERSSQRIVDQIIISLEKFFDIQQNIIALIVKNTSVSALRDRIDRIVQGKEENLIQALSDSLFPYIKDTKQVLLEHIQEIESQSKTIIPFI